MPNVTWGAAGYAKLMADLTAFEVPRDLPKVNVLLFGGVGAGKSSLISSVDSLFKGRISRRAAHGQGTGSYTRILNKFTFKHTSPQDREYQAGELGYILDGNVSHGFDLSQPIHPQSRDFFAYPALADRVHCVCFVVPSCSASDQEYTTRLKQMKKFAMDRGIPTLVFLTKVDEYDPEINTRGVSSIFSSARIAAIMSEVASLSGSGGTKDVFPMKSFSNEYEPTPDVGVLIMRGLQHALFAAQDYLDDYQELPASAAGRTPTPRSVPLSRQEQHATQQQMPPAQGNTVGVAEAECEQLIAAGKHRISQVAVNPYATAEKLEAELAAWDEEYYSSKKNTCPSKWQLRSRFINGHFAPLLRELQDRETAAETAAMEAAAQRQRAAEAAAHKERTLRAKEKEAAEKLEQEAAADEQRERDAAAAAARAQKAEAAAKRARESEAAAKKALEAEAAAGRARQAEAERQRREAEAAAQRAADAAAAAQHTRDYEAAARAALEAQAKANAAEVQWQKAAAAAAAKRAADAEATASVALRAQAAANKAREEEAAAHRARQTDAERQRQDAELAASRAREAEANAMRALEAEVAARRLREAEAAAEQARIAEAAAQKVRETEAAAKATREAEAAAARAQQAEAQRRLEELELQAEQQREAAKKQQEEIERAELERQKSATVRYFEVDDWQWLVEDDSLLSGFSELLAGEELRVGQCMASPDGRSRFAFQEDGNLVVYKDGTVVWATNTSHARPKPTRLTLQEDGNLVLYGAEGRFAGWASNTDGKGDRQTRLVLQNGGTLILRNSNGRTIWSSGPQLKLAEGITVAVDLIKKFQSLKK
ncbi:hypothetical protein COCSUDRAFT_60694 [Coccomyxa subellipsoidea C-169]|uniref:Bulb-type lectin domain-containing protein n=1 Tax=Coccomyxa subellipsoidea (strain C-169) TaxID=574566 RepID=I0Z4W1_COCSC|nr:hypothetical protein COCSUDRAFT_60694 [Coccomyxa subellipsoidea C-169]EIE25680.1 hypothetical protein COCSUDRAFT_60694 [Coccomyxa subellipsoidea C-169]|eukprot:XP_005650224.1 hypothetical protein COCSUDRAFT_60694 [Coccomyxa subellipsoidea C-169]